MNNRLFRLFRSRRGLSLIEIILAATIIAVAAAILVGSIGSTMSMVRRGADREQAADAAYRSINSGATASGTVTFRVGSSSGRLITVSGVYYTAEVTVGQSTSSQSLFVPAAS